jgi:alpha-ketoglutarate-dependent taurine dioxygenase
LDGDLLYSVRDEGLTLERDYGRAGVRTSKTRAAFQFHTDSPSRLAGHTPDYIGLLVLRIAKSGGETALVSGYEAHNILAAERPDLLERLYRPFWVDRRAELPPGEAPVLATPVFTREDGQLRVRYLRFYIAKGHEWKGAPLTSGELEALDALDEVLNRPGLAMGVAPEPGDIQLVNNRFVLHSRTAYDDFSDPELKRHYLRIWLGAD